MGALIEPSLSDDSRAMIDMMKIAGYRIEWELFSDLSAKVKMYKGTNDYSSINVRAESMDEALETLFGRWNEQHNGYRSVLDD